MSDPTPSPMNTPDADKAGGPHAVNDPAAPCSSMDPTAQRTPRRRALLMLAVGLNAVAAMLVGIPLVGYFIAPLVRPRRDQWIRLEPVDQFRVGETRLVGFTNPGGAPWDGPTVDLNCYVRRLPGDAEFQVFAINCAHLGCPVSWFPSSGLFLCPCHGGVYYEDGSRASGPPPRGLYEYDYRIVDGHLEILGGHLPTLQNTLKRHEV